MSIPASDPRLKTVSIAALASYAKQHGWHQVPHPNERVFVFEGPPDDLGEPLQLILPRESTYRDTPLRLAEAINLLAEMQDDDAEKVLGAVQKGARQQDSILIRVVSQETQHFTLPLDQAAHYILTLRDLIAHTASAVQHPNVSYRRKPLPVGTQLVQQFRFAQTFSGSFGFRLEAPLGMEAQTNTMNGEAFMPLERQVVIRLMRGLGLVEQAISQEDQDLLSINYQQALNANMCAILIDMLTESDAAIEYSVEWATDFMPPPDLRAHSQVRLDAQAVRYLRQAYDRLTAEETGIVEVVGTVETLNPRLRIATPVDERFVSIKYAGKRPAHQRVIHLSLPPQDYRMACDAHRDGHLVKAQGQVVRQGRHWVMQPVQTFQPLPEAVDGDAKSLSRANQSEPHESEGAY